jgi:hypothetical protein
LRKPSIRQQIIELANKEYERKIGQIPKMIKNADLAKRIRKEWLLDNPYRPGRRAGEVESFTWSDAIYLNLHLGQRDTVDFDVLLLLEKVGLDPEEEPSIESDHVRYTYNGLTLRFWIKDTSRCKIERKFKHARTYEAYDYEVNCD